MAEQQKSELVLTLEHMINRRTQKYGPNAPETLRVKQQLESALSKPVSAKAMFLMGGRKHSGNAPASHRRRKQGTQ